MEDSKAELRWGVEQRLEFIEFRRFWEGRVNRNDLMDQFGVSVNQASADLNRYISASRRSQEIAISPMVSNKEHAPESKNSLTVSEKNYGTGRSSAPNSSIFSHVQCEAMSEGEGGCLN